jgi:apolipoprotein N-acyltransferase
MQMYNKLIGFIQVMSSKKLMFLSFIAGALAALGFAPFFWIPLTFFGFSFFYFALTVYPFARARTVFWYGWFFGLGFFSVGLYWIALAMHVDWWRFGWIFPFALFGVPSGLAVVVGIVAYLTDLIKGRTWLQFIAFGAFWSVLEWVRGHTCPVFPWLLISDVWLFSPQISQALSVMGSYGLGLLTVYLVTMPALARKDVILGGLCFIVILWFAGDYRLKHHPTEYDHNVTLYLVQPNILQSEKWDPALIQRNLQKLYRMSQNQIKDQVFIIWPESAIPFPTESESTLTRDLGTLLKDQDYLAFGFIRMTDKGEEKKMYNSIVTINNKGQFVGLYDKSRLVPFGEYVPLRAIIPNSITKLTYGPMDYSAGSGPRTIFLPNLPSFSPLICYEIIFPGQVTVPGFETKWILNLTNDGWYLDSSGPYQHFQMARARAIEEGIPVVRVANTGISCVIDPCGRVLKSLAYGKEGVIIQPLPQPISGRTLFVLWRDVPYLLFVAIILMSIMIILLSRKSQD